MSMANVLLVPYPFQSHINPMLQFAKRLASKGVPAALLVTRLHRQNCPGDNAGVRSEPFAGLPGLERWEFPSFVFHDAPYPALTAPALAQFADRDVGDWVLVNSFDELEYEVPHIKLSHPEKVSGKSETFSSGWAEAPLQGGHLHQVAGRQVLALRRLRLLRQQRVHQEAQLPRHVLDVAATASGDALVVRWSPQLDVLAHRAVGCFVTHCGWNSTLEALGFGVPMVALPLWTDQPINARLIEEAWGAGVRARRRDASAGVFPRGEIEQCVRAVMEDEDGRAASARAARVCLTPGRASDKKLGESLEFACAVMDGGATEAEPSPREAARRWSEAARAAVAPGGSSDQNLEEFVDYLRASAGEK
uniref:Uncharacterized protein n=1 Tax=Aegilops tauschii TaxID=37682 RepID=R7W5X1_AEGTA